MRSRWLTALATVAVAALVTVPTFAQTSGYGSAPGSGTTTSSQPAPSPTQPGTPMPSIGSDPSKATPGTPQTGTGKSGSNQVGSGSGPAGSKQSGAMAGADHVKSLQKALQEKGMDPGPIDGVMGPKTQAALREFQKDQKLPETGRADAQTLEKLGVTH